jgi:thioredoxin-related protein
MNKIFLYLLAPVLLLGCVKTDNYEKQTSPLVDVGHDSVKIKEKENKWVYKKSPIEWRPFNKKWFKRSKPLDKPVVLLFTRRGCKGCFMLNQGALKDKQVAQLLNKSFTPIKLNETHEKWIDLAGQYGVEQVPTIILFDFNGREIMRITGPAPSETLIKVLTISKLYNNKKLF